MKSIAFLFGSGISRPSGAPGVCEITDALLNHGWQDGGNLRFSLDKNESVGIARRAQDFLHILKNYIDQHLQRRENRGSHYEDLFSAAEQILQDEKCEIVNPMICGSVSEIKRLAANLYEGLETDGCPIVNMKADFGVFVTTSYFAKTAVAFAGETDIQLIDGYALADLMAKAFPGEGNADEYRAMCRECGDIVVFNLRDPVSEIMCRNGHLVKNDSPDSLKIKLIAEAPSCEKCGSKMRLVKGRFGRFWGCSNYPNCRNRKRFSAR